MLHCMYQHTISIVKINSVGGRNPGVGSQLPDRIGKKLRISDELAKGDAVCFRPREKTREIDSQATRAMQRRGQLGLSEAGI
jgi:hypothetical protein